MFKSVFLKLVGQSLIPGGSTELLTKQGRWKDRIAQCLQPRGDSKTREPLTALQIAQLLQFANVCK